jgi:hypothetical protein
MPENFPHEESLASLVCIMKECREGSPLTQIKVVIPLSKLIVCRALGNEMFLLLGPL